MCDSHTKPAHFALTHTHTTNSHTQKERERERETCTHICTIVVIERLFKEAQLSKILVYYAESSPPSYNELSELR